MEYEGHESEIAREAKALLLDLINRVMPHLDYKGAVAFLPGDARILKKKIIRINNLLADRISLPVWPDVVIPGDRDEIDKLLKQFTDGQRACFVVRFGRTKHIFDSVMPTALALARKVVKANQQAEQEIR